MGARPAAARSRVDLPEPEGPIRATISPAASDRLTPSRARRAPKVLETPEISSTVSAMAQSGRVAAPVGCEDFI